MKKILGRLAVGMIIVGGIVSGILYVAVSLREQAITQRKPLTVAELDHLARTIERPGAFQTAQTAPRAAAEASRPMPLPGQLERLRFHNPEAARRFDRESQQEKG